MALIVLTGNNERELEQSYSDWENNPYEYVFDENQGEFKKKYKKVDITVNTIDSLSFSTDSNRLYAAIRYTKA